MSRCFAAMDSAVTARRFGCSRVLLTVAIFVCSSILPDFTLVTHEETLLTSLSNAFTSAFKTLDPIPRFKATAKLGGFLAQLPA
jgi:hypothetical protein